MTLMKLEQLDEICEDWRVLAASSLNAGRVNERVKQIPTEIADRAIEALKELTERVKALDAGNVS